MTIALVTMSPFPELLARPEHERLTEALARRGVTAETVAWSDAAVDWARFELCVLRSPWDYHLRREEFLAWTARVPRLLNPPEVVRWNSHKGYLRDLEARGVPIIPTHWLAQGAPPVLPAAWAEAVVKPAVSAGALNTVRFRREAPQQAQATLERILATGDAMVQPYLRSVETDAERSLIFFDRRFSHAMRRLPVLELGAHRAERLEASAEDLAVARQVLAAADRDLLYARVDLARDDAGALRLMELEVIEPRLFFDTVPEAADRLAGAIVERLR